MKSEAEILNGLRCCQDTTGLLCMECPYYEAVNLACMYMMLNDAYIFLMSLIGGDKNEYGTKEKTAT